MEGIIRISPETRARGNRVALKVGKYAKAARMSTFYNIGASAIGVAGRLLIKGYETGAVRRKLEIDGRNSVRSDLKYIIQADLNFSRLALSFLSLNVSRGWKYGAFSVSRIGGEWNPYCRKNGWLNGVSEDLQAIYVYNLLILKAVENGTPFVKRTASTADDKMLIKTDNLAATMSDEQFYNIVDSSYKSLPDTFRPQKGQGGLQQGKSIDKDKGPDKK